MQFDFAQLKPEPKAERPTDPITIFQRLRVTDPSINDLWLAQGDALRGWHEQRNEKDVAISLNTGAGKTLVGLLIGQSLVNETRLLVLYACSSIQLVQQTEKKALGYGLPITTYVSGEFSNDLAAKGEAVCITTYQALFNGKSVFFRSELGGIVFDDAHTAEHLLRDHFSLRINKERFSSIYSSLTAEFADYFDNVGLSASYNEICAEKSNRILLVHPAELPRARTAVPELLAKSSIRSDESTTFAWAHLKDRIDLCAVIIGSHEITITPAFVPVRTLPYFLSDIRRIYLSATLSASDAFVRTFGRKPSLQIRPSTTVGECERMILVPSKTQGVDDDIEVARIATRSQKTLILVPSYARAEKWSPLKPPPKDRATNAIEEFKGAKPPKKLLLPARYDGVDLPGEMCRVVIIDDLPSGIGPLERYLWEYLRFSNSLRTAVASRVVQSFGRISRGMSDHGVVLLTGRRLVEWLQVPKNVASLPRFLQKQLQLGFQMSANVTPENVPSMVESCLSRSPEWISAYERFIRDAAPEAETPEPEKLADIALSETKYAQHLWNRDYSGAASQLQKTLDDAEVLSTNTACWHKLWIGYAIECSGDKENAGSLYRQAHALLERSMYLVELRQLSAT